MNKSRHRKMGPNDGHSHSGNGTGRDKSGHGKNMTERERPTFWGRYRNAQVRTIKKVTEQEALTNCRPHQGAQLRTGKERDRVRGTHELDTMSGGTCQNTGTIRLSEGDSHPGVAWGVGSGHGKKVAEREALTSWRLYREAQVRIQKECNRQRAAHQLETESGGISQTMERMRLSEALTSWAPQSEGQVRTRKEWNRARDTDFLETASRGTIQDMERIQASVGNSPTGDHIERN